MQREKAFKGLSSFLISAILLFFTASFATAGNAYLVLDAKSGKILAAQNADVINHPASLTKMMTLYMTFEAMHKGRLGWNSRIVMSPTAAAKIPTKLGAKAGETITVREAVQGMIVVSANDAAAAMAEALAGSEEAFAARMTARARDLGMRSTVFTNASGLPDDRQITTARDMSILAVALMNDYPKEYKLFALDRMEFRGKVRGGHNRLMYRYDGMDGIKTGYTNASGYNIVTAVKKGSRRVIGVVMGGRTAKARDAQMAELLDRYVPKARSRWSNTLIAAREAGGATYATASVADDNLPTPLIRPTPSALAFATASEPSVPPQLAPDAAAQPAPAAAAAPQGWKVQIAAAPTQEAAIDLLAKAQPTLSANFSGVTYYTESVATMAGVLYRARFAGFDSRDAAASACEALKARAFTCMLVPDNG
ncbi:serine hydrolase [Rhizobium sp. PAMB 3182]